LTLKIGDFIWGFLLAGISAFFVIPSSHAVFLEATRSHPILMGFVKVSILATMGELLSRRIVSGNWERPLGLHLRFIVWGLLGMSFVVVFDLFSSGTGFVIEKGYLPTFGETIGAVFCKAFWTSALMNLIFAPTFMAVHRITDGFIDECRGRFLSIFSVRLSEVTGKINWIDFMGFVVLITIPCFWIPAHTITFLLPAEYRVLAAAYLSIALGAILSFAKIRNQKVS